MRHPLGQCDRAGFDVGAGVELVDDPRPGGLGLSASAVPAVPLLATLAVGIAGKVDDDVPGDGVATGLVRVDAFADVSLHGQPPDTWSAPSHARKAGTGTTTRRPSRRDGI